MIGPRVIVVEEHGSGRFHVLEKQPRPLMIWIGLENRLEAAIRLFVMIIVFVKDGQIHEGIDMHRRARANPLIKLNRLGIVGLAIVKHRQPEAGLLVVWILVQGPLIEIHRPLMLAMGFGFLCLAKEFFSGPFVDRRNS